MPRAPIYIQFIRLVSLVAILFTLSEDYLLSNEKNFLCALLCISEAFLNLFLPGFYVSSNLRYSLRQALIVYRLIDAALIENFHRYPFIF